MTNDMFGGTLRREMCIAVVLNPAADRGRATEKEVAIARGLKAHGVSFEIFRTEAPGHATELARKALEEGFSIVAAAGGDGTVNEVAQALVNTEAALGVIPIGSGNDFVKAVGIPKALPQALEVLCRGRVKEVDVGVVETEGGARRYFFNCFGAGIDGQIALDYKRMRYLRGELGYLWAAVLEVIRFRGVRARVEAEGFSYEGKVALLPLQNGPFAGGGFHVAPGASPDDGLLDMVIVDDRSIPRRFPLLKRFRDGTYFRLPGIKRLHVKEARVELERSLPAHLDGEVLPRPVARLRAEVVPGALKVVA